MSRRKTPDEAAWLAERYPTTPNRELADAFEREFGWRISPGNIACWASDRGIVKSRRRISWRDHPEYDEFLRGCIPGRSEPEIARAFEERFGVPLTVSQIANAKTRLGVRSGTHGGCFEPGHAPANKGRPISEWMPADAIERCRVNRVLDYFRDNLLKAAENIDTDAEISLALNFDGCLNPSAGEIPAFDARLTIPRSTLDNKLFDLRHELALDAEVHGSGDGVIDVRLNNFHVKGKALHVDLGASVHDLLGADPLVDADAGVQASLDTLSRYLRRRSGLELSGNLSAEIRGGAALSQLDPYQLAQTDISGKLRGSRLRVVSEKDSISFLADSLDVWLGAVGNTRDSSVAQGERMLALTASVDSIFLSVKDDMRIAGRSISLKAQNSAAVLDKTDSSFFYPFGGRLDIGSLSVVGADTTYAAVTSSSSIFKISPKSGAPEVPVLTLDSSNGGVFLRGPVNRIFTRDLDIDATAAMNSIQRRRRSLAFVDSLARMNPDVPRDSLFRHYRRSRGSRPMPDWLSEDDFRARDIRIDLGETLTRYLREWDFEGSISLVTPPPRTPRLPVSMPSR